MDKEYEKTLQLIQVMMKERIGLERKSMVQNNWATVVNNRMAACNIKVLEEYYQYLQTSLTEPQKLVEEIVIPETWFFREPKGYRNLSTFAKENQINYRGGNPLRVLSIGCSTGEEPYSIAMTLIDEEYKVGTFRIDAFDISTASLKKGMQGLYGDNSFRDKRVSYKRRFFEKQGNLFQIKKEVQSPVHFFKANIINTPSIRHKEQYDVIFCRNILIYLTQEMQESLMKRIVIALKEEGIVILGESELSKFDYTDLKITNYRGIGGVYSKKQPTEKSEKRTMPSEKLDANQSDSTECKKENDFELIKKLADEGNLDIAQSILDRYINEHGKEADSLFLLGIIEHAKGNNNGAEDHFKKALYLDPSHYESLIYLSLLTDGEVADEYRLRAQKVMREKQPS